MKQEKETLNKIFSPIWIWIVFLVGLLIRLLLMPIAMHADLLSMYWRANLMASHGIWVFSTNQYLGHLIYAINLLWMRLIGFDLTKLFIPTNFGLQHGSRTASVGDWMIFNELANVNTSLFWMKMPHLIADIFIFVLLIYILKNTKHKILALSVWWLNPVVLYAFYVFSRHDSITTLFVLIALIAASRNKMTFSILGLFAAAQIRVQPLMLAPVFAVDYWKNKAGFRNFLLSLVLAGSAILIYQITINLLPVDEFSAKELLNQSGGYSAASIKVVDVPTKLVVKGFGSGVISLPLFGLIYLASLYLFWRVKNVKNSNDRLKMLNLTLMTVVAGYFATQQYSPHYFAWLALYPAIASAFDRKIALIYGISVLFWVMVGVFAPGAHSINQNLFLPISTSLFYTPQLADLYQASSLNQIISSAQLYSLFDLLLRLSLYTLTGYSLIKLSGISISIPKLRTNLMILGIIGFVWFTAPNQVSAALLPVIENNIPTDQLPLEELVVGQTFISPSDSFGAVQLKFDTNKNIQPGRVWFRIKKVSDDEWWFENSYDTADFYNRAYYPFGFAEFQDAAGEEFYFEVEADTKMTVVSLLTNNDYVQGEMLINEASTESDLVFRIDENKPLSNVIELIKDDIEKKIDSQKTFLNMFIVLILLIMLWLIVIIALRVKRRLYEKN